MTSLQELLELRDARHRILAGTQLGSVAAVRSWIDEVGVTLVAAKGSLPRLTEAIVGRQIDGSWWGDPDGGVIYRLLTELEDTAGREGGSPLSLVDGKATVCAPAVAEIVTRVAGDAARRQRVVEHLDPEARALLAAADAAERPTEGLDDEAGCSGVAAPVAGPRKVLAAALLVRSVSEHTESGRHAARISRLPVLGEGVNRPQASTYEAALGDLIAACLRSAVVAPEREVARWFRFVEPDAGIRAAAVTAVGARTFIDARTRWMTLEG